MFLFFQFLPAAIIDIVIAVFSATSVSVAAELYVSPAGNDAADGSLAAPLATLAAARNKADQLKSGSRFSKSRTTELRCFGNRLFVYHKGDYTLTLTTSSGRVVGRFSGKGDANFLVDREAGLYLVDLATKKGSKTGRFMAY